MLTLPLVLTLTITGDIAPISVNRTVFTLSGDNADPKSVSTVSVNIMKIKIEITRDDHLSQTYEQP